MPNAINTESGAVTLETHINIAYKKIEETIKNRHSCRSYTDEMLNDYQKQELNLAFSSVKFGLLGENADFRLEEIKGCEGKKVNIGTYGMIVNPHTVIIGEIENSPMAHESYGFLEEQLTLKAEELGLNTCWLGYYNKEGNENWFKSLDVLKKERVNEKKLTPAICIVGYGSKKAGLWDKTSKIITKPLNRKPFGKLFYDIIYDNPLAEERAGRYYKPLDMVRPAPSAGNVQPWRVIMEKGGKYCSETAFHFFMEPKIQSSLFGYNKLKLHNIDMGIAMCHFELITKELGYNGNWERKKPDIQVPDNVSYTATWVSERK